jgi:hypothetical protein
VSCFGLEYPSVRRITDDHSEPAIIRGVGTINGSREGVLPDEGGGLTIKDAEMSVIGRKDGQWRLVRAVLDDLDVIGDSVGVLGQIALGTRAFRTIHVNGIFAAETAGN